MSLAALAPSDIKLLKMREYKELAATVGVACYGSKNDIANRIQGAPHGAFILVVRTAVVNDAWQLGLLRT